MQLTALLDATLRTLAGMLVASGAGVMQTLSRLTVSGGASFQSNPPCTVRLDITTLVEDAWSMMQTLSVVSCLKRGPPHAADK